MRPGLPRWKALHQAAVPPAMRWNRRMGRMRPTCGSRIGLYIWHDTRRQVGHPTTLSTAAAARVPACHASSTQPCVCPLCSSTTLQLHRLQCDAGPAGRRLPGWRCGPPCTTPPAALQRRPPQRPRHALCDQPDPCHQDRPGALPHTHTHSSNRQATLIHTRVTKPHQATPSHTNPHP